MPTDREWRQLDHDRADQNLVHRAAAWLREDPDRANYAGLSEDLTAHALAALLEFVATSIADLEAAVRCQAVEACRVVLGQTMANPTRRRTRRHRPTTTTHLRAPGDRAASVSRG